MAQKFISVCIPSYEMNGFGQDYLRHSLNILTRQTFKDFEVVVSDHSKTDVIEKLCEQYRGILDIHYIKNAHKLGSSSANTNSAIQNARGKLIKILFQDDFLYHDHALEDIVHTFDLRKDQWLVTACEHSDDGVTFYRPFYPQYNPNIHLGKNTISSPSVLTIKNDCPLVFDENLIWLMDCDYYKRCFDAFGPPKILNLINVVNRTGAHQVSNTNATPTLRKKELNYVKQKFGARRNKIKLPGVTLVAVSSIKINETIKALELSMADIEFADVVLISHEKPAHLTDSIHFKQCSPIRSLDSYSQFMAYDLAKFIQSAFALVIQYDGYVVRPKKWDQHFLDYDYIGAPWPSNVHFTKDGKNIRVGNGGFSLRSQRLLNSLNVLHLPFTHQETGYYNEDGIICNYYRTELEEYGIRFAPPEVASRFSHEQDCRESVSDPFGFHKNTRMIPRFFFLKHFFKSVQQKI